MSEMLGDERQLLIVEDDDAFARTLTRSFERRGYQVVHADSLESMQVLLKNHQPGYAVVDLKLKGESSGLACVQALHEHDEDTLIVVLTGYGAIATAVAAVKIGATDYLSKPADANDITNALLTTGDDMPPPPENPMSADRVRWEHIQRVYELCDRNVSETARRLNMHRRTLQRILAKRSPR